METNTDGYQGIMHMVADKLMEAFEGSDAINYIEQIFEDKESPERCFVLTMQMKEGFTPCQKLEAAKDRIKEIEQELIQTQITLTEIQDLSSDVSCFIENLNECNMMERAKAFNKTLEIGSKIRDLNLPEFTFK